LSRRRKEGKGGVISEEERTQNFDRLEGRRERGDRIVFDHVEGKKETSGQKRRGRRGTRRIYVTKKKREGSSSAYLRKRGKGQAKNCTL